MDIHLIFGIGASRNVFLYIGSEYKMSHFAILELKVKSLKPVLMTDNLLIMNFETNGYQCIVNRLSEYAVGQNVLFFPPEAIIPARLVTALNISGYLAMGNDKDVNGDFIKQRVRSIKLKGIVSEGLVLQSHFVFDQFDTTTRDKLFTLLSQKEFTEMTALMGVVKYKNNDEKMSEKTIQFDGSLYPLRNIGIVPYDVERWQNYTEWLAMLLPLRVFITEKVHGDNGGITYSSADAHPIVFQRNFAIRGIGLDTDFYPDQFNSFGRVHLMRTLGYFEKIVEMREFIVNMYGQSGIPVDRVTIRGEKIGNKVQSNYYKSHERTFYAFDIEVDGCSVNADIFLELCQKFDIPNVPVIAIGVVLSDWIGDSDLNALCEGASQINNYVMREGIVIKPMIEDVVGYYKHRLFLKAVSVSWLELMGKKSK